MDREREREIDPSRSAGWAQGQSLIVMMKILISKT